MTTNARQIPLSVTAPHTPRCTCGYGLSLFRSGDNARCWRCINAGQAWRRPAKGQARLGTCGECKTVTAVRRQEDGRDVCDVCAARSTWPYDRKKER